jgi:hypothetical protein
MPLVAREFVAKKEALQQSFAFMGTDIRQQGTAITEFLNSMAALPYLVAR